MYELFRRHEANPLITFRELPYPANSVFNPGVAEVDGEVLLLLRVEDLEGRSHLTVARSHDGATNWRIETTPLLAPGDPAHPYEGFGCEDARLTYLDELGLWIIAYTAYSSLGTGVALATTRDFRRVDRIGLVLPPNNKDAAVFPRRINGKWQMLHRPAAGGQEHIWLTESDDLYHWARPLCVLQERGGPWWDGTRVGAGTVPLETEDGWLILYHGVKQFPAGPTYRLGLALLDRDHPERVLARVPHWVLGPHELYEMMGEVHNVVFTCGCLVREGDVHVYYGATDSSVCLATARLDDLLALCRRYRQQ